MFKHIVQSSLWGQFKTSQNTKAVSFETLQFTLHKIPYTKYFYAYAPKVNLQTFKTLNINNLKKELKKLNAIAINFDCPNILKHQYQQQLNINFESNNEEQEFLRLVTKNNFKKAPRTTFSQSNVLLDLTPTMPQILANMHSKHRYNANYAQKKGVTITNYTNTKDLDVFYDLLQQTSKRQKYFIHNKNYYQQAFETLYRQNKADILIAWYQNIPLASWMLFFDNGVGYYPYGGSSELHKNLFASNLIGLKTIETLKNNNCTLFDMWGACENLEDTNDPWWGFTNFKLKFNGIYVKHVDSYDLIVNNKFYVMFNLAQKIRWKILSLIR